MAGSPALVRDLDLPSLAALLAVIESGSFTLAAAELGVSQPAISLAIKRLEERVGTALVVRNRKAIAPTRPGEVLASAARAAFDALQEASATIANEKLEPSGRVVLGCHESLAAYALPAFMAGFLREFSAIDLRLWNGTSSQVEAELTAGRIDLGLIVNPSRHPDTIVEPLFDDSVELFHCLSSRQVREPREMLAALPLIYVPELPQSQDILRRLHQQGVELARLLPCSSLELVKNLVLDRVGIGVLPERVAKHGTGKKLRSLSPPMPRYRDRIALVRRFDLPRSAAIRAVTDGLVGALGGG